MGLAGHWRQEKNLSHRKRRRPVLLNNWEVTEFDFTEDRLLSLAQSGAELGIELFVMDDGWFGTRNHDKSGLGDWSVNLKKLPSGLAGFSQKLRNMGMQFGIWIEPEMVNEDSDLYRAHPDWSIQIPGRCPNLERCQLVLNLSLAEVRDTRRIKSQLCEMGYESESVGYLVESIAVGASERDSASLCIGTIRSDGEADKNIPGYSVGRVLRRRRSL